MATHTRQMAQREPQDKQKRLNTISTSGWNRQSQGFLVFIMHTTLEILSPISWSTQWEGAMGNCRFPLSTTLPPGPEQVPHRGIPCSVLCQIQDNRKLWPSWTRTQPQLLPECFHKLSIILPTSLGSESSEGLKPSSFFIHLWGSH